jgi:hypothetical protein
VHADGSQIGPLPVSQVKEMFRQGALPADAVFWCDGMPDWMPVAELPH